MSERSTAIRIEDAQIRVTELEIRWGDGHRSRFHAIWLRHQCECSFCGSSLNGVRGIRVRDIPEMVKPEDVTVGPDEIEVVWSHDGHRSRYQAEWLRNHCYSGTERQARRHRPTVWDSLLTGSVPIADFAKVETNPAMRLEMLEAVCDYGISRIADAPTTAEDGGRLVALVGAQRQTNHGSFELSAKDAVDNVGDTSVALDPHVDEPYRLSAIGITVFQVLQPAQGGGDSTLVDGFEVARRLREDAPEAFQLLAKTPITCHRVEGTQNVERSGRRYASRLPVIRLDSDGEVVGVRLNERQIAPLDIDAALVEPYYRALRRILELAYDPDLTITLKLGAGDGLLFNNQRVLHGRTSFEAEHSPKRSVLTRSVDLDDFYSTIRVLKSQLGETGPATVYGQGMAG